MGRVQRIEPGTMTLAGGTVDVDEPALYVDCSADGLERCCGVAVFDDGRITLESARGCQQVFSAGSSHTWRPSHDDDLYQEFAVRAGHPIRVTSTGIGST